jgi:Spy/CpxP family protein refolding chaperone
MRMLGRELLAVLTMGCLAMTAVSAAETPSEAQLERLMQMASQTPDRPDHDYVSNSLQALLQQSQDLKLSREQTDKIRSITDQYERTRRDRETAYKRSEMEALKLIHDNRSSLFSIETAVQKADQEHSKLRMAGIKALREARDVLGPEQYGNWRQSHARVSWRREVLIRSEGSNMIASQAVQGAWRPIKYRLPADW